MTLTRLRELAINQSADGVELEASTLIHLLDTIDCLKAALEYCAEDDPMAVDPDNRYDYSSADAWKKLKARAALAKLSEDK